MGANISKNVCVMNSFKSFAEWQSIKEMSLTSRAKELSQDEAAINPDFEYPMELFNLWLSMPGEVPHFNEITASIFSARILPSVFIMDVVEHGSDFRWRLFGTDHAKRFGSEVTGKRMSAVAKFDRSAGSSLSFGRKCYDERAPVFFKTEYFDGQIVKKATCAVALPLAGENGGVERLFGCSAWC